MSQIKLYVPNEIIDVISSRASANNRTLDLTHPCIQTLEGSSSGDKLTLVYKVENDTRYYSSTMYWLNSNNNWSINSITNSTTAPNRCINTSQSSPSFTINANSYDEYVLTDNYLYHPNFDSILVIFFIILLICIYFPYRIIARAFGRWLKL